MKKILIFIIGMVLATFSMPILYALPTVAYNRVYVDFNQTYPLVLIPQDNNIVNISLYTANSSFNFTWTGTQYELNIIFSQEGDYPFIINSTDVSGNITGILLVRKPFNVTFRFYKEKRQFLFFSNKYINNVAFVTAEFSDNVTYSDLETFLTPLKTSNFRKRVFHSPYVNGETTLKMYERNKFYGIRIVDGIINFESIYALPNVSESYGINAYVGNYYLNGSNVAYDVYLPTKVLMPYRWLSNIALVFAIIISLGVAVIMFFMIPDHPAIAFGFGIIVPIALLFLRGVIFFWTGN